MTDTKERQEVRELCMLLLQAGLDRDSVLITILALTRPSESKQMILYLRENPKATPEEIYNQREEIRAKRTKKKNPSSDGQ